MKNTEKAKEEASKQEHYKIGGEKPKKKAAQKKEGGGKKGGKRGRGNCVKSALQTHYLSQEEVKGGGGVIWEKMKTLRSGKGHASRKKQFSVGNPKCMGGRGDEMRV